MLVVSAKGCMSLFVGLICFFGLGLLGLAILGLSIAFSRSRTAVVIWGIVASVPMALECALLTAFAGIGSATSGSQAGYRAVTIVFWVLALSLVGYFPLALYMLRRRTPSGTKNENLG
jgi:hypothetical protein